MEHKETVSLIRFNQYHKRYGIRPPIIIQDPEINLGLVVVIPAYNERSLLPAIQSLFKCNKPSISIEVIVVFNAANNEVKEIMQTNLKAKLDLEVWLKSHSIDWMKVHLVEEYALNPKHAGVGLARKIGMDEACRRFSLLGKEDGIIACFDADSTCSPNYFEEIIRHFNSNLSTAACSIHFEHPLIGDEFPQEIYNGICLYELHLRYYKLALGYAKLPFSFHTIGSSMAVKSLAYMKQGGMNKRKAGEDFYFLQKFMELNLLSELKSTTVIPSPRISDRVPFGTGRALLEMKENGRDLGSSFDFNVFLLLKEIFKPPLNFHLLNSSIHPLLLEFLGQEVWELKRTELLKNTRTYAEFEKRFFQWFNAFKTLKFIHFLRDHYFPNQSVISQTNLLLGAMGRSTIEKDPINLLNKLRQIELETSFE